jgi:hypothetical protein
MKITLPESNVSPKAELSLLPETRALLRDFAADDYHLYETLTPPKTIEG